MYLCRVMLLLKWLFVLCNNSCTLESSEVPQDITVSALSSSNAILQWKPPPAEHQNGIVVSYSVRVSSMDTADEEIEFSVNDTSAVVSALHPFYSYRFAVAAVTVAVGPFSNPVTLQMPESGTKDFCLSINSVFIEVAYHH